MERQYKYHYGAVERGTKYHSCASVRHINTALAVCENITSNEEWNDENQITEGPRAQSPSGAGQGATSRSRAPKQP